MTFVTERVNIGQEFLTIVFPSNKLSLLNHKIRQFIELKSNIRSIERFITINGGYIK